MGDFAGFPADGGLALPPAAAFGDFALVVLSFFFLATGAATFFPCGCLLAPAAPPPPPPPAPAAGLVLEFLAPLAATPRRGVAFPAATPVINRRFSAIAFWRLARVCSLAAASLSVFAFNDADFLSAANLSDSVLGAAGASTTTLEETILGLPGKGAEAAPVAGRVDVRPAVRAGGGGGPRPFLPPDPGRADCCGLLENMMVGGVDDDDDDDMDMIWI